MSWGRKIVHRYGGRIRDVFNAVVARDSLIGDPPVFEPSAFAWARPLEQQWAAISDEADSVVAKRDSIPPIGDISPDHQRLDYQRTWRTYFLWGYGVKVEPNCACCPITARLVESVPGMLTAMYSIHEPGTHLPPHRGVTKGLITCHLGLRIPADTKCRINVEGTDYHWREGKFFIFDDTCRHEVFNETSEDRVVLLMHVRRPLGIPGRWIQDLFFWLIRNSPFVREAQRNLATWGQEQADL